MGDWGERLAGIDDDYLIGISNKGIVKRAYKDKEETTAEIVSAEDEAQVKVGGETVSVRYPLGESRCSCPSRSICRHVVQAILVLRESCSRNGEDGGGQSTAGGSGAGEAGGVQSGPGALAAGEAAAKERSAAGESAAVQSGSGAAAAGEAAAKEQSAAGESAVVQSGPGAPAAGEAAAKEQSAAGESAAVQSGSGVPAAGEAAGVQGVTENVAAKPVSAPVPAETAHSARVLKEISEYPFAKLKKALGNRHFQTFVNQAVSGIRPEIQYTSVVTMQLPEPGITVKLLSPLEYSTCTCHKKELCRHKAAAILWCQLEAGAVTKEDLAKEATDGPAYDLDEVREAAGQMEAFLEELFGTGLSRVSPEVPDYLERLAIISHNAGLARFEGYFRALADSYDRYLKRKAAFQTRHLMEQLTRLYHRVGMLGQAKDAVQTAALAGEFRADYLPVGKLDLIGIAAEQYKSQTGYEGETIYFLEENTKKWYTYTNAKPVFYDRARRGRESGALQGPAPWGLPISMENLLKVRIRLTGAKCDGRNRLSSSQESKGEITGDQSLCAADIRNWYYRDFGRLFGERIERPVREAAGEQGDFAPSDRDNAPRGTELVFVRPDSCAKAEFSQTGQQLTLPLYDRAGRELLVEVVYSKEEAGTIRYLERIAEKKLPCFLGKVYLRDGRLRMYPVDVADIEEPDTEEPDTEEPGIEAPDAAENLQGQSGPADREPAGGNETAEGKHRETGQEPADEREPQTIDSAVDVSGRRTKYQVMESIAGEILLLMEDLCQSGFEAVHDSTLKDLRKAARLTEQYGMQYLSELLGSLGDEIESARHRMDKEIGPLARLYRDIIEYMNLLTRKTAYDRGADYYA
ncbi:MAG: hypothetical protein HFH93_08895 [Lachnospiraceae bacterium]|nr:hypothetical protein [Lachnospiraceae bacterium]